MSINSVSNPYQSYTANAQNGFSQMQNDFQQLGQALQSGNMGAARQDYLTIQQLFGQSSGASHSAASTSGNAGPTATAGTSSNPGSSSDNNIVGRSMQTVISQYLSNSIAGGLLGGSGLLSNVLGGINISV